MNKKEYKFIVSDFKRPDDFIKHVKDRFEDGVIEFDELKENEDFENIRIRDTVTLITASGEFIAEATVVKLSYINDKVKLYLKIDDVEEHNKRDVTLPEGLLDVNISFDKKSFMKNMKEWQDEVIKDISEILRFSANDFHPITFNPPEETPEDLTISYTDIAKRKVKQEKRKMKAACHKRKGAFRPEGCTDLDINKVIEHEDGKIEVDWRR